MTDKDAKTEKLSCTNCDHFGEGCEDCEVNEDD